MSDDQEGRDIIELHRLRGLVDYHELQMRQRLRKKHQEALKIIHCLRRKIEGDEAYEEELRGQFKRAIKQRDQARQRFEGAEEVFHLIRIALWGHNKEGDIVEAVKELRKERREYQEALQKARNEKQDAECSRDFKTMELMDIEDVAVKHGYDKETGECLIDWLDKHLNMTLMPNEKAQRAGDKAEILALREAVVIEAGAKAELQLRNHLLHEEIDRIQDQVDHWHKKYQETINAND